MHASSYCYVFAQERAYGRESTASARGAKRGRDAGSSLSPGRARGAAVGAGGSQLDVAGMLVSDIGKDLGF
jgi:hypothetical protein